jgi:hypothetical protein
MEVAAGAGGEAGGGGADSVVASAVLSLADRRGARATGTAQSAAPTCTRRGLRASAARPPSPPAQARQQTRAGTSQGRGVALVGLSPEGLRGARATGLVRPVTPTCTRLGRPASGAKRPSPRQVAEATRSRAEPAARWKAAIVGSVSRRLAWRPQAGCPVEECDKLSCLPPQTSRERGLVTPAEDVCASSCHAWSEGTGTVPCRYVPLRTEPSAWWDDETARQKREGEIEGKGRGSFQTDWKGWSGRRIWWGGCAPERVESVVLGRRAGERGEDTFVRGITEVP